MAQMWADGGVCLVCLVALPRKIPPVNHKLGRKPIDIFLKICELLNVPFSEMQQDWHFTGNNNDKLPFCSNCLETIQGVIALQEQLETIQKLVLERLENIRVKIRQSSSCGLSPGGQLFRSVHNFRSKALGTQTSFTTNNPNAFINLFSSPSSNNTVWTIHPQEHLYTTQQQVASSSTHQQQYNYISTQPASVETPNSPLSSSVPNYTLSHAVFQPAITNIPIAVGSIVEVISTPAPINEEYPHEYFDGGIEDALNNDFSSGEDDNSVIPAKRPRKSGSTSNSGRGRRAKSPTTTKQKRATTTATTAKNLDSPSTTLRGNSSSRQSEYFSPVQTDDKGNMTFEGITISLNKDGGYVCGLCSAVVGKSHDSISLRKTKIHIKGFHLGAYKCDICEKNFTSNDILSQHVTRTHELGDKPCDICGKPIRPRYMLLHQYTHMNAEEKAALVATGFKPPESLVNKEKKYPCPTCGVMFKKRSNLRVHEGTHMDEKTRPRYKCDLCDKSYTNQQTLKDHVTKNHTDSIRAEFRQKALCKICGKSVFVRVMGRHLKTHVAKEDRPYSCKVCAKRFLDPKILKKHEESFHKDGDTAELYPFACDICGKRSSSRRKVRMHRRRVHKDHWKAKIPPTLLEDVTVDDPGDDFMLLEDLNNEGLQHVNGDVYSYHLYEIRKIVAEDPEQQQTGGYKCCTCLKEYSGQWEEAEEKVKQHVKEEHIGNYRCNLCTKRMKNLSEVMAHKRSEHMHMSSYNCSVCMKPGIPRKSIVGHQWSHKSVWEAAEAVNQGDLLPLQMNRGDKGLEERETILRDFGEKLSFMCGVCRKEFGKLEELSTHRKMDHKDLPRLYHNLEEYWKTNGISANSGEGKGRGIPKEPCVCSDCGKAFAKWRNLRKHIRTTHKAVVKIKNEKGAVLRRSARRKREEVQDVIPEGIVKVEIVTDEEEEDDFEEDCEEGADSDVEIYSGTSEDDEMSDPEYTTTVKNKVGNSPRTRRSRTRVNYAEESGDDDPDEDDGVEVPTKSSKRKQNRDSVGIKKEEAEEDKDLLSEGDIKQSPHSSNAEGNTTDQDGGEEENK